MENAYKAELKKEVGEYLLGSTLGERKENLQLHGFLIPLIPEHRAHLIENIKNELVNGGYFPKDEIHFNQLDACFLANRPIGALPTFRNLATLVFLEGYTTAWNKEYMHSLGTAVSIDDFTDLGSKVFLVGKFHLSDPMVEIRVDYNPKYLYRQIKDILSEVLGVPKESVDKIAEIYSGNGQVRDQFGSIGTLCSFEQQKEYGRERNFQRKVEWLYNILPEFMRYGDKEEERRSFTVKPSNTLKLTDTFKLNTNLIKSHVVLAPDTKVQADFLRTHQKPASHLRSATAFAFEDALLPNSRHLLSADKVILNDVLKEAEPKGLRYLRDDLSYYIAQAHQNIKDIAQIPPFAIERYEWFLKKELDNEELGSYVRPNYISDGYDRFNRIFGVAAQSSRRSASGIEKEYVKKAIDEYSYLLDIFNLYVRQRGYSEKSEITDERSKNIYHNAIILSVTQGGFAEETLIERCGLEQKQFAPRFENLKLRGYILTMQKGMYTTKNAVF